MKPEMIFENISSRYRGDSLKCLRWLRERRLRSDFHNMSIYVPPDKTQHPLFQFPSYPYVRSAQVEQNESYYLRSRKKDEGECADGGRNEGKEHGDD